MFNYYPKNRISADSALEHDFFSDLPPLPTVALLVQQSKTCPIKLERHQDVNRKRKQCQIDAGASGKMGNRTNSSALIQRSNYKKTCKIEPIRMCKNGQEKAQAKYGKASTRDATSNMEIAGRDCDGASMSNSKSQVTPQYDEDPTPHVATKSIIPLEFNGDDSDNAQVHDAISKTNNKKIWKKSGKSAKISCVAKRLRLETDTIKKERKQPQGKNVNSSKKLDKKKNESKAKLASSTAKAKGMKGSRKSVKRGSKQGAKKRNSKGTQMMSNSKKNTKNTARKQKSKVTCEKN